MQSRGAGSKVPGARGKLSPFLKSAVTAISKMVKNTAPGPLNADSPTAPAVGCQAQEFSLANARARSARAGFFLGSGAVRAPNSCAAPGGAQLQTVARPRGSPQVLCHFSKITFRYKLTKGTCVVARGPPALKHDSFVRPRHRDPSSEIGGYFFSETGS